MIIGSMCPWATALGLVGVNGLQVHLGWVTLGAGLAIGALQITPAHVLARTGWVQRRLPLIELLLGAAGLLACLLVILGLSGYGVLISPAWGVYVTLIAAAVITWQTRPVRRTDTR